MNFRKKYSQGFQIKLLAVLMLCATLFNSCSKLQFTPPANVGTIRFANAAYTIERNAGATTITLPLSLPLESDATAMVTIDSKSTGLAGQYTLDPAIPAGGFTLNLPKGSTQATFNVTSAENFEGDITIVLDLSAATGGVTVANSNASTVILIHGKPIVLPAITASVSSLAFGNVNTTTTSASQNFTVTGVKLTAPVSVTADAGYKVSLDNVTFTQSVSITAAAAMAAPVTVYAEFVPNTGVNQAISGNITIVSGTLSAIIPLTGTEVGNAAPGVLIASNDFSYGSTNGSLTTASGGVWSAFSAAGANPIQYVSAGLTYTGYVGSGVGGALVTENKTASAEDGSMSFAGQGSGTVYIAQLYNFVSAPTTADFFSALGDGAAGATPLYYNRMYAKLSGSQFVLGISRNASTTPAYTATPLDYGTTYLVVSKYDFTNGTSSLYILSGAIPTIEPATPQATSTGGAADPSALTRVVIRQSTNLSLKTTVDGIRIATSWKQVVGL